MDDSIGVKIKKLRKDRKLTLKQVSDKTNLSISFLSQVERLKSSITLESLKRVSEALDVNPSYFFSDPEKKTKSTVIRNALNDLNNRPNSFIYKDLTSNIENPLFTPFLVMLKPGDNKGSSYSHKGQEFLYVLEGTLTILMDDEEYDLYPSDCMYLDSTTPHNWMNKTGSDVKFLCISSITI
ncbi:helix-turn-helix transcriptional regulator [Bacillus sp. ISL-34]|uniref:helix-turn-helix domain-containing protein n=1 Tax=Bacillus sp. ISL-34 TaxID=2819121 RepID=UPI001BECA7B8|nr:XRE family transcriptional regulator [Bacillus sp. ISL-34]MBT2645154.1 helix-turn-helix transcriptional regulator [Bacillus sp. ISL-34]